MDACGPWAHWGLLREGGIRFLSWTTPLKGGVIIHTVFTHFALSNARTTLLSRTGRPADTVAMSAFEVGALFDVLHR